MSGSTADGMRERQDSEAIQGIQKKDFIPPKEALGRDVPAAELPDGIRFYIKGRPVVIDGEKVTVNIYRLEDGAKKQRKINVGMLEGRPPEDDEIALWYGPGDYCWIAKWVPIAGGEPRHMLSDVVNVGESWLLQHLEYKAKQEAKIRALSGGQVAPAFPPAAAPAAAPAGLESMGEQLALIFGLMERMASIVKSVAGPSPAEAMAQGWANMSKMGETMFKAQMDGLKEAGERIRQLQLAPPEPPGDDDDDDAPEPGPLAGAAESPIPAWMQPFMPLVEGVIKKLIGGGPEAAEAKQAITSSDWFKMIFSDPDKWGQAVSALEMMHGTEATQKALDVLLNRRKPPAAPAVPAGKGTMKKGRK